MDWPSETRNTNGGDEKYITLIEKLEGVSLGKCMRTAQGNNKLYPEKQGVKVRV